jgi:general secretion pathway protein L
MGDKKRWPVLNWRKAAPGQVVPVPSEAMLILGLTLPPLSAHQRTAAALFAAEPLLAQPLEEMQVVLGPQLGPEPAAQWLAVFMTKTAFQALMQAHSGSKSKLVPDALLLPRPPEGQWSVARLDTRFLARLPDGTGFAADETGFRAVWAQSGRPGLSWQHGTVPPDMPVSAQTNLPLPLAPEPALARLDLAEDRLPDWRHSSRLAALAAVLLLGLAASLCLLAFDAHRLTLVAEASEAQVRQALSDRGIAVGTSVDAAVAQVLHSAEAGRSPGFLAQLSFAFDALGDLSGNVTLQDISFDNRTGRLSMTLIAPELGTLQQAATLLTGAGFKTDLGTSTLNDGQARATVNLTQIGAAG